MKTSPARTPPHSRRGSSNPVVVLALFSLVLLGVICFFMMRRGADDAQGTRLFMYCAAGMRKPIVRIAEEYKKEFGVDIELQFNGSNTLLNQIELAETGDLYLAADESYIKMAADRGLTKEEFPVAFMRPVIAVGKGNPKKIATIDDLLRDDVKVALGNPDQAAIGKKSRKLLRASKQWDRLEKHVTKRGVFKPTVPEIANDVKLGSTDAAIIWDAVAEQMGLDTVRTPELDKGEASITLGVLGTSKNPTEAIRFARYVAARDKGMKIFEEMGYRLVDGDVWGSRQPTITFYAGSVNRGALEPVIEEFAEREGVEINTIYNGCGVLTAQMRTILSDDQSSGFPDVYMACDVYYLETVQDLFEKGVNVSNADIVMVVAKGNPKNIRTLKDLVRPDVRLAIGQPKQCTIGVLTRNLLKDAGIYDQVMKNDPVQTMTSALLIPNVTTGSSDVVIAYKTDTLASQDRLEVIAIDSPKAVAVQPYSIARSSDHKYLGRRLFAAISQAQEQFESKGFRWQLSDPKDKLEGKKGESNKSDEGRKSPKQPVKGESTP